MDRGRRTGFQPRREIKLDPDGLEDVNDFFDSESESTSTVVSYDQLSFDRAPVGSFASAAGMSNFLDRSPSVGVDLAASDDAVSPGRADTLIFLERHAKYEKKKELIGSNLPVSGYGLTYKFSTADDDEDVSSDDSESSFITLDGYSSGDHESIADDDEDEMIHIEDLEPQSHESRYRALSKENFEVKRTKEIVKNVEKGPLGKKFMYDERGRTVRRSTRMRYAPLDYWRNERVEYKKDFNDALPSVDKIVRIPEPVEKKRRRRRRKLIKAGGFEDNTGKISSSAGLRDRFPSGENEYARRIFVKDAQLDPSDKSLISIAVTRNMLKFEPAPSSENLAPGEQPSFEIARIFTASSELSDRSNVWAAGVLKIYPKMSTPERNSLSVTEMFYLIYGEIEVSVKKSKFYLSGGSHFYVPPNHDYQIGNLSSHDALLTFTSLLATSKDDE